MEEVKNQAQMMGQALVQEDYSTYVNLTFPGLVKAFGGSTKMISQLQHRANQQKEEGLVLHSIRIDPPAQISKSESDWYSLVLQNQTYKVKKGGKKDKGGVLETTSYLIAFSSDKGSKWYFIDTAALSEKDIRAILPSLPKEFKLPTRQLPIFAPH